VGETILRDGVLEGAGHVGLSHQVVESLGSIFPGKNLITHTQTLSRPEWCERRKERPIK